jgi:hypothetical protein
LRRDGKIRGAPEQESGHYEIAHGALKAEKGPAAIRTHCWPWQEEGLIMLGNVAEVKAAMALSFNA